MNSDLLSFTYIWLTSNRTSENFLVTFVESLIQLLLIENKRTRNKISLSNLIQLINLKFNVFLTKSLNYCTLHTAKGMNNRQTEEVKKKKL